MPLSIPETLDQIKAIHARKPLFSHPLWTEWVAGTLSKQQLQETVKQYGIVPLHNQNYHGRLYIVCPDPEWRSRLAEVCYEEGTGRLYAGGVSHHELYLRFGEALGISREEMYATEYCAGAQAFKAYFSDVCGRNFLEGVAAHMLASEAPVPEHGNKREVALKTHYGLSDEALKFFTVHEVADEDHSNIGVELLTDFSHTEADLRLVIRTVEVTIDVIAMMYDDIYRKVKALA